MLVQLEKQPLLDTTPVRRSSFSCCKALTAVLLTLVSAFVLARAFFAPVLILTPAQVQGEANWDRFTTLASTVANGKHFVWKFLWDLEGNRFRFDVVQVKTEGDDEKTVEMKVESAKNYMAGEGNGSNGHHSFGSPVTMLFVDGGKGGEPQCRHYDHDYTLPALNPLEGATEHGLSYAHKFVLTNHFSDVNWPHHGRSEKLAGKFRSELWVDAFSNKPLAAEAEGDFERDGETHHYHAFHHFYKFFNWVDESQVTPPKQFTGVCREVGHSGELTNTDDLKDFEMLLRQFVMF